MSRSSVKFKCQDQVPRSIAKEGRIIQFKTKNRFETLQDNEEEDLEKLLKRLTILQTPKRFLKKCRYCNFKKRSCALNPSEEKFV